MKSIVLLVVALLVANADSKSPKKFKDFAKLQASLDAEADWTAYCTTFNVNCSDIVRQRKFLATRAAILQHDADQCGYAIGFNKFSSWSDAEIEALVNKVIASAVNKYRNQGVAFERAVPASVRQAAVPASQDWRLKGVVTPVKDQGQCGSCYTFAAAEALESAYAIKYGILYNLTSQQYVDCAQNYSIYFSYNKTANNWDIAAAVYNISTQMANAGCNGGWYHACWMYNNMIAPAETTSCYNYTSGTSGKAGTCSLRPSCGPTVTPTGFVNVPNEAALLQAVGLVGPVACAFDATGIHGYTGGIVNVTATGCGTSSTHAINVVGYGTDNVTNQDYWIVRNSWGPDWGEDGYFRLPRGVNACGIGTDLCAYPLV